MYYQQEFFNRIGQILPLELPRCFPELAAHEWRLSANGEVRYTRNTGRSNGCFRGIIEFR
jgi:hypothetical protein